MESQERNALMNSKPIERLKKVEGVTIAPGTLIGFRGMTGGDKEITASYPVWRVIGDEIQFLLTRNQKGQPIIDNTWFSSEVWINKDPIVIDIEVKNPVTFGQELGKYFTKSK